MHIFEIIAIGHFVEKITICGNFFKGKFWEILDIQLAISGGSDRQSEKTASSSQETHQSQRHVCKYPYCHTYTVFYEFLHRGEVKMTVRKLSITYRTIYYI